MSTPASRFQTWVESLSVAWGKQLGAWSAGFVMGGIEAILDKLGKKAAIQMKPVVDQMEAAAPNDPVLKPIIDEMKNPTGESAYGTLFTLGDKMLGSIEGDFFKYFTRNINMGMSYIPDYYRPRAELTIQYYLRGMIDKETFYFYMRGFGIDPANADQLVRATQPIFPSEVAFPLWLRNKTAYQHFVDELPKLGLRPDQIKALQELAYRVPGSGDVIRYMVKEVYDPGTYKAFGQDQEFPGGATDFSASALQDAEASGVKRDHLLKEWIAHWNLPGSSQGFDLLHRGEITEAELGKLLKALDIMPFWRDKLTALSWDVPNRVELRMLARYGLVDREFIIDALKNAGLREDYRPVLADLMLAQGLLTDMSKRYSMKWINSEELKAELVATGMDERIRDRLYTWIVKNNGGDRISAEKELTAAEILKGYKKHLATYDETVAALADSGYDPAEAAYKIAIDTTVVAETAAPELTVQVDTIRRQRRARTIDRNAEVSKLTALNISNDLVMAYADNDDLRLVKLAAPKPPSVLLEYETDPGKVQVESIRLSRRQQTISRLEEITSLTDIGMTPELATSIADNDDLRLVAARAAVVTPVVLAYQTDVGKAQADNIRLTARERKLTAPQTSAEISAGAKPVILSGVAAREREIALLTDLEMPRELAEAYAENDELRMVKITGA